MTSNSPFTRFPALRRRLYRSYPDDLSPSRLAVLMAHAGTLLELLVPALLAFSPGGPSLRIGLVLMLLLHGFITSNVPMGVPLEWNVVVVYGAFALFARHPDVSVLAVGPWPLAAFLLVVLLAVPLAGNLVPSRISFLPAMRYYAGNWAYSVWLFRGDAYRKLDALTKSAAWIEDQLARFYDERTAQGLLSKVMAFRLMHLHGRALGLLLPRAIPIERLPEYTYVEGELVAGLVLGWNFGDGHLHREELLSAVQERCGFVEGELRCVFVEAQPLFRGTLAYRIHDAKAGLLSRGEIPVDGLLGRQPWATST